MTVASVKRQRVRRSNSAFKALRTTPATAAFKMVADGRVRLVSVAGCIAGTTAATLVGPATRTIKTPLLAAGGSVRLNKVSRGVTVTPSSGFNVDLDNGLGKWKRIASIA